MFGVPLLLMFLKEPLTNLVEKKSKILPEQKGMFFVQSFFELFEVLLSYLSTHFLSCVSAHLQSATQL